MIYSIIILLVLKCMAIAAQSRSGGFLNGREVEIENYPYMALMERQVLAGGEDWNSHCGGVLITVRTVLSAAHCYSLTKLALERYRYRLGSSYLRTGGTVHAITELYTHPGYTADLRNIDFNVMISRLETPAVLSDKVALASIAGNFYEVPENEPVTAVAWGLDVDTNLDQTKLHEAHVTTIDSYTCYHIYNYIVSVNQNITFCAGIIMGPNQAQTCGAICTGPLLHEGRNGYVVVGITSSYSGLDLDAYFTTLYSKVSVVSDWIVSTALDVTTGRI